MSQLENKLHDTFDKIYAEDRLKEKTADFLHQQIQKRHQAQRMAHVRSTAACVCVLALVLLGGLSYNLYFTPSVYVDMDVNPSIELTLNCFGRVLQADPYNEQGMDILKSTFVSHKTYKQAVQALLDEIIWQGYMRPGALVSVTVQANDKTIQQKILDQIQGSVDTLLVSRNATASINVFAVSQEVKNCAHVHNLSPAKYLAITQLQEIDPTATFEGCAEHSISEIWQLTQEHSQEHHNDHSGVINADGIQTAQSAEENCLGEEQTDENECGTVKGHNGNHH